MKIRFPIRSTTDHTETCLPKRELSITFLSIVFVAAAALILIYRPVGAVESTKSMLYFYSPETNINNFAFLKGEFDSFLRTHGDFGFQPFSDRGTFESNLKDYNNGVLLVSSWHYLKLRDRYPIEPIFVGVLRNKSTQRHILCSENSIDTIESIAGQKVASAGSEEFTRTILKQILGAQHRDLLPSIEILIVPKDIDALLAVGFGMVKYAMTTEYSLANLAKINPYQYSLIRQLASSNETLLPIVAALHPDTPSVTKLLNIIEKMGAQSGGGSRLNMINLDGLRRLNVAEIGILSQ